MAQPKKEMQQEGKTVMCVFVCTSLSLIATSDACLQYDSVCEGV